ncbi:hypothetical protein SAY86_020295 [Trapa natans]|uniref:DYW domain-containing protein n=1 Tax=Trapa natans TaxID=22666 RepID=A0AAN7M2X3_TRANT|nr:hypothetical protein SAY86_020295 [Trapa natans]
MGKPRSFIQNVRFYFKPSSICIPHSISSKAFTNLSGTCSGLTDSITLSQGFGVPDLSKNRKLDRACQDETLNLDVRSCTRMIVAYARNGRLVEALQLFEEMSVRDVVSWNIMIKACLDSGELGLAWKLFDDMPEKSVVSWTTMISGFFKLGQVDMAQRFFSVLPTRDVVTYNTMLHGYFSNCRVEDALRLFEAMPFPDVISWTSVIGGLDQNGRSREALLVFQKMAKCGVFPASSTLACVLSACGNASSFLLGVEIHGLILKWGFCSNEFISSALITFYSVSKHMDDATKVFSSLVLSKNVVIWTAFLTAYGSNNKHDESLRVFANMFRSGIIPNQSSFSGVLNSCCSLEALDQGREIHTPAIKLNLVGDLFVCNSLIVMYSKCGSMNDSMALFSRARDKNLVTWNAAISGCAQHGRGILALALFALMLRVGMDPDEFTFTALLSACSHSGLLQKGRHLFEYFSKGDARVELKQEHYSCMVDLLGRCGKLDEAEELIKSMTFKPNSIVWLALLSAGKMHSNLDVSERAMSQILKAEPHLSAAYVLMSNLYASVNKWKEVSRLRVLMKQKGIEKQAGSSWVTVKGQRHVFLSGDRSHPLNENIYQKIDWLNAKLKELGYVPDRRFALHDTEDEQREESLSYHSERLAIALGLISTVESSTIIVMKNLRVCGDCHSVIKLIGLVVGREIVVRDSLRFHHFKGGACSCGDYW